MSRGDDGTDASTAAIRVDVLRGAPTAEEIAAVVAVVSEAYAHEAAAAIAETDPQPSAWQVSTRSLRTPLRRDTGWGHFAG